MKKSLIALAVLAASGAAMAQSSVSLFGIIDTGIGYVDNATPAGGNKWGMSNSGNATSRIGFRGVEDLGGGLKAGFWLEGEVGADDGNGALGGLNFRRRSTVGLEGNFGEVRLGRDLTAGYNKTSSYDLFGQTGMGQFMGWTQRWAAVAATTADETGIRSNNLVSYYTPNFGGFKGGISYGFDEQVGTKAGRYVGGNVSFDNGPISVALSYDRINLLTAGVEGDRDTVTLAGSYNFGVAKLIGIAQRHDYDYDAAIAGEGKVNNYALGVSAPVGGAGEVKLQYARYDQKAIDGKADQLSLGYVHNLSKRTAVYGTVAYMKNKGASNIGLQAKNLNTAANGNDKQTGVQVGVRHSF